MSTAETEALIRLAKAMSWLDSARWSGLHPDNAALRLVSEATARDRILAHWLTYITDRMRRSEDAWHDGAFVFSKIAVDYGDKKPPPGKVEEFLDAYRAPAARGRKMRPWSVPGDDDTRYTARYEADDDSIRRTLWLLANLGWSFVDYLAELIHRFRAHRDALRRVAHCLDMVTYRLEVPIEQALSLLKDDATLAAHFSRWNRSAHAGHKRLWAALRDYRKPGTDCHGDLQKCGLVWPQENFDLDQLELPGDVWNIKFFRFLVEPVARRAGIPIAGGSAVVARRIYEVVKNSDPSTPFYPEQFDTSFDFARRMCDTMSCWCCPFWKNKSQFLSAPEQFCRQEPGKPCALALITSGYAALAGESGCPFCQGLVGGLCDGLIPHLVGSDP
jgi:hypothetical protein